MNKFKILNEIKSFLEGYNNDLKYLVNIECNPKENYAECIIHPPDGKKEILQIKYTPFMYMKDLKKNGVILYNGDEDYTKEMMILHGIKIQKLKTGNQKRLEDGYCYKISSYKSYNNIINFLRDGGVYLFEKAVDDYGKEILNNMGKPIYLNLHLFFSLSLEEQFLIDKKARLFKGYEEYKDIHKVTFDIETTGLRPVNSRVFAIGIRDNKGFETILEVDEINNDVAEANLIRDFFNVIAELKPAIISGFNSEEFDFYYILERAKILKIDLSKIPTSLKIDIPLKRKPNSTVKIGNSSEKYTATKMWGYSVIDILHAAKRTAAINSDIKSTKLKYLAKFEKVAKDDRTYIPGEDNDIGRYYHENPIFLANEKNEYIEIPTQFKTTAHSLFSLQQKRGELSKNDYKKLKKYYLDNDPNFVKWYTEEALSQNMTTFVFGKTLLRQYLLDDLYETEAIDELYNQTSFMLAKIVPTTYDRICTMGTASIWNLLLTAWSYEKDIAIPHPDVKKIYPGGLSRCYKTGYSKRIVKIDYSSLYPMLQLTWDIFPIFDITGVMKNMLIYTTTTRNIYKKLGKNIPLNEEELELTKGIDHETYVKFISNSLTQKERNKFNIKQLPIKILNNSQYGALGSDIAFNWSDNVCATKITTSARLELRHAISWFSNYGLIPLLAVTDGINFQIPNKTKFRLTDEGMNEVVNEGTIEEMWKYKGMVGVNALIEFFNDTEMKKPYMSVDNDGEYVSCLNLSRINYATLQEIKDNETEKVKNKIKLTGNTIKSKVLPEYIEEFIDKGLELILEGKGFEFVEYYYSYVEDIFYKRIPLKKIASKSKYKQTIKEYLDRGYDKNGRMKGKQAHMELIIQERKKIAEKLFQQYKNDLHFNGKEENLSIQDKMKLVSKYMPPEPELDSMVYYVNTGYRKSHGDSQMIKDIETGEERFAAILISNDDLTNNPNLMGDYNVEKYFDMFNKRICYTDKKIGSLLSAFNPEIAEKIPARIVRKKIEDIDGKTKIEITLERNYFTRDQLQLMNFDKDDIDESMYLEEKEVDFWNETGYDPRLVWDGFKMHDNMKVHFEIYENALKYLNIIMKNAGKPLIKSRNEKIIKGDYVLIKNGPKYSVGYHNGNFIEIVRDDVKIPKSDVELMLDKKFEKQNQRKNLKTNNIEKITTEIKNRTIKEKKIKYYPIFKKRFNIPFETYEEYIENSKESGDELLEQFIKIEEIKIENENSKYLDFE